MKIVFTSSLQEVWGPLESMKDLSILLKDCVAPKEKFRNFDNFQWKKLNILHPAN